MACWIQRGLDELRTGPYYRHRHGKGLRIGFDILVKMGNHGYNGAMTLGLAYECLKESRRDKR